MRVSATHDCGEREDEDEGTDRYIDEDEDHDDAAVVRVRAASWRRSLECSSRVSWRDR